MEFNKVVIPDQFDLRSYKVALAAIHTRIKAGYDDVVLDFSGAVRVAPSAMAALVCCICKDRSKASFTYQAPSDQTIARMFVQNGWDVFVESDTCSVQARSYAGSIPLTRVSSESEVSSAVDAVIETILRGLRNIKRSDIQALEWSLNEVLDNVFIHSQSTTGAFIEATIFSRNRVVDFVVCDDGIGIPASMRRIGITDPIDAVLQATREGITSRIGENKGNGLYGTLSLAKVSETGHFMIDSQYARLFYDRKRKSVGVSQERIPFPGTLVHWSIGLDEPRLIERALVFKGKSHEIAFDYLEKRFAHHTDDSHLVRVSNYRADTATRPGGRRFRTMIENLALDGSGMDVVVSFFEVPIISSSFADEVFAKLISEYGEEFFSKHIKLQGMNPTIIDIVAREIASRCTVSDGGLSKILVQE